MKRAILAILLTTLIAYSISYSVQIILSKAPNVEIAAHRGDSALFPENTMPAFISAYDKGADYIELDLHQTKDGVVVVIHDSTLDRTTTGTGKVSEYTYEKIRKLDVGGGTYVPKFEEVLALAKEKKRRVIAEIKSPEDYPGIQERVYSLIEKEDMGRNVVIASFDKKELEAFKKKYPMISTCLIYDKTMILPLESGNSEYVCIPAENTLLNPWGILYAHRNEKKVFVWFQFLENDATTSILKMMGIDGLIINNLD